ncbi:MAG: hypothetical protein ACRDR6_28175, partial [Pseudonocardiaceae bacterium]
MTRSSTGLDVPAPDVPWSGLALAGVARGTLALGLVGSLAVFIGGIGCAAIPVTGPIPGDGLFAALGYGPGREVATVV